MALLHRFQHTDIQCSERELLAKNHRFFIPIAETCQPISVSFLRPQITTVASNPATANGQVCFGFVKNMQQESTKKTGFRPSL